MWLFTDSVKLCSFRWVGIHQPFLNVIERIIFFINFSYHRKSLLLVCGSKHKLVLNECFSFLRGDQGAEGTPARNPGEDPRYDGLQSRGKAVRVSWGYAQNAAEHDTQGEAPTRVPGLDCNCKSGLDCKPCLECKPCLDCKPGLNWHVLNCGLLILILHFIISGLKLSDQV